MFVIYLNILFMSSDIENIFGKRLRKLRKLNEIPIQKISDLLGCSLRAYHFYEDGSREPNIKRLIQLADFFDVSLDYLVGRSDDPKRH